jgi:hypothetical protein
MVADFIMGTFKLNFDYARPLRVQVIGPQGDTGILPFDKFASVAEAEPVAERWRKAIPLNTYSIVRVDHHGRVVAND